MSWGIDEAPDNYEVSVVNYITPPDFKLEIMTVPMHAVLIVGSMGSGKTTWVLNKIGQAAKALYERGVDDNEILVIHTKETPFNTIISRNI